MEKGRPWTAEEQKAAAAKGGASTKRLHELPPSEMAQRVISRQLVLLARNLVNAALGREGYEDLTPKERMVATIRALEWGIGRPRPMNPLNIGAQQAKEDQGLEIE